MYIEVTKNSNGKYEVIPNASVESSFSIFDEVTTFKSNNGFSR